MNETFCNQCQSSIPCNHLNRVPYIPPKRARA